MKILLVEDEKAVADPLAEFLRAERYAVDMAVDGVSAEELNFVNDYDLIVLDWSIPPPTGIDLLHQWRADGDTTPILMLTGRHDVEHRVNGLDSGADDYLTKPFSLEEFLARVRSLLRRREKPLLTALAVADVNMNRATHEVTTNGTKLDLSPKEFAILEYFLHRPGQIVTRSELIEHVWDESFDSMSNVVDVTIYRLRSKIDGGRKNKILETVKGVGYILRQERV